MANTYTQIYMHIVFAVNKRESLISERWEGELYRYLTAACQHRKHFVHAIGGTADHIHMLVGMHPAESVSDLVKSLKAQSSKWINETYMRGIFGHSAQFALVPKRLMPKAAESWRSGEPPNMADVENRIEIWYNSPPTSKE